MTDEELILRAGGGDRTAFQLLCERHWKPVYRYAWLLSGSVAEAEDVTQECFLVLVRAPRVFDPTRASLRAWLLGVARNQYLRRRRAQSREADPKTLEQAGVHDGIAELLHQLERAEALRQAVAALPELQREALFLFEFEGLSLAETAEVLGIEANAVKARLFRAREQLKLPLAPLRSALSWKREATS